jgi:rhomboid family GlyGly-CTERM serine protease
LRRALVAAAKVNAVARAWATRVPWTTPLAAGLAVVVQWQPAVAPALLYERARILDGEAWRLWTGHWVHLSAAHLLWNLAVLVPAGVWAERIAPQGTRLLFGAAPGLIGLVLLAFVPGLESYGGLSGLASGLLAGLAFNRLAAERTERWFWWSVLGLLAVKIGVETFADQAIFARFAHGEIRAVPLAHVAGVLAAAVGHFACVKRPSDQ